MTKFSFKLYSLPTIGDGSCFLHAILRGISPIYTKMSKEERIRFVRKLRVDLSGMLECKPEGKEKTYYEILSRGQLKDLSEVFNETKLSEMKRFLKSNNWFSHLYVEFISEIFDIDIYIIDYNIGDIYNMGDDELFYKGRDSVIIGYASECHFETLSVKGEDGNKRTYFSSTSPVIRELNSLLFSNRIKNDQKTKIESA